MLKVKRPQKSTVWANFKKLEAEEKTKYISFCTIIEIVIGCTSGLLRHLKTHESSFNESNRV